MRSLAIGVGVALAVLAGGAAQAKVYWGKPVAVGHGWARTVVATDATGKPSSVAVVLSEKALDGLPTRGSANGEDSVEYVLSMPAGAPDTGYREVALDWNPHGHPPAGIYDKPHFDFHFYLIDAAGRQAVTFKGEAAGAATAPIDKALLPPGYAVPPPTAVEHMGVHGVDTRAPEFHGHPFDKTFIYGYYRDHLTFVEPMVSLAYLRTRPDVTLPVGRPAAYSLPGYYPGRYRVGFDAKTRRFTVALTGLEPWKPDGPQTAAAK